MEAVIYPVVLLLFLLGVYGLLTRRNMIRMTISFNIMEAALLLFLVAVGYREGGSFPIVRPGVEHFVDPLPHALALTAIVIGASTTALMLTFIVKLYKRYGTLDIDEIRRLRG